MKRFAIIGVGGYIAPRHLKAIKDTGNVLIAAMDLADSVGILDSYFPETQFFTEFERFERHLEKLHREHNGIDYLVICTPNYLHDAHIRCGIRVGADVICEKPVTIKPHNLKAISHLAKKHNRRIYTIMQMRLHPSTKKMQEHIRTNQSPCQHYIEVKYIASRGRWYDYSWKGNNEKSGGLIYNLGIHFIDLLIYLFGEPFRSHVDILNSDLAEGTIAFQGANVEWKLSKKGMFTKRTIKIDDTEYDYNDGFDGLHTRCYESILKGEKLFDIDSAYDSIKLADELRNVSTISNN